MLKIGKLTIWSLALLLSSTAMAAKKTEHSRYVG
jgi:hypothetical protein